MEQRRSRRIRPRVASSEVELPGEPDFELPTVPTKLTELGEDDLMELFAQLTRYASYLSGRVVRAEIDERHAEQKKDLVEARFFARNFDSDRKDSRVTAVKNSMLADPEIAEANADLNKKWATRKLRGVLLGGVERDSFLVSRELTRRTNMSDRERRADRWTP